MSDVFKPKPAPWEPEKVQELGQPLLRDCQTRTKANE